MKVGESSPDGRRETLRLCRCGRLHNRGVRGSSEEGLWKGSARGFPILYSPSKMLRSKPNRGHDRSRQKVTDSFPSNSSACSSVYSAMWSSKCASKRLIVQCTQRLKQFCVWVAKTVKDREVYYSMTFIERMNGIECKKLSHPSSGIYSLAFGKYR